MTHTSLTGAVLISVLTAVFSARAAESPKKAAQPFEHRLRWMERVVLGEEVLEDGDPAAISVFATLDLDARGWPASLLRRAAEPEAAALPFSDFHQVHGLFAIAEQNFSLHGERTRPVAWRGEGRYLGLLTPVGGQVLIRAPFWLPEEWMNAVRHPAAPPEQVRSLQLRQVITFVLPPGMPRLELPAPAEHTGGPLEWRLAWKWEGHGRRHLEVDLEVLLRKGELDRRAAEAFQKEFQRLYGALGHGARYSSSWS